MEEISVTPNEMDLDEVRADDVGFFKDSVIPTAEIAVKYARMIFTESFNVSKSEFPEYYVSFDKEKNFWLVTFVESKDILGGGISIAISKDTGEVLLAWGEE